RRSSRSRARLSVRPWHLQGRNRWPSTLGPNQHADRGTKMFNWFSGSRKKHGGHSEPPTSGLSRWWSTKPYNKAHRAGGSAQPGNRKQERLERRELLYAVVR